MVLTGAVQVSECVCECACACECKASIASADEDAETAALMAEMARLRAENAALAG